MEPLSAPVRRREKRYGHFFPLRRTRLVIRIIERMGAYLVAEINAIRCELRVAQKVSSPHISCPVTRLRRPSLAAAILHRLHLHVVPVLPERAQDAAMVRHVAVPVGSAFPDAHGGKMRWLQRCDVPLIDAIVGDAVETDLAGGPRLARSPLDTVIEVPAFRAARNDRCGRATGRCRANRHARLRSRLVPIFPDRRLPSSDTCLTNRRRRRDVS